MTVPSVVSDFLVVLGYILVSSFVKSRTRRIPIDAKEAPLAKGWPIIGIFPYIEKPFCNYLMTLGHTLGGIFRMRFGMREIYVLNNHGVFKKCFKDDGENFSGRWKCKHMQFAVKKSGIIFMDGDVLAKQRSFIRQVFRDFGIGRARTTEIVQEECRLLLEEIDRSVQSSVDFSEIIPIYTANVISTFVMKKRYERGDEDFKFIERVVGDITKREDYLLTFFLLFPTLDQSSFFSYISFVLSSRRSELNRVNEIFRQEIKNHSEVLDLTSEGEDFMDRFLIEQSKTVTKTGSKMEFTDFQLIRASFELLGAGFDTTSTTLGWALMFLSRHVEIQDKVHEEIVSLIGSDQLPSSNDKKSLPFTQAVMDEILRLGTVVPLSIFHRNFRDAVVDGIFIPANSLVFPNIYSFHRDPRVWEKPFEFHPGHFLTESEDGEMKYTAREDLVPFGLGKRQCLGESLARAEYFIFLASIIQRFRVRFARDVSESDYQKAIVANDGAVRYSNIKDFVFERYEMSE